MSKSILVVDTPESCFGCLLSSQNISDYEIYCSENSCNVTDFFDNFEKTDWCPLKEMPEKKLDKAGSEWLDFNCGFNSCIDEILNGSE